MSQDLPITSEHGMAPTDSNGTPESRTELGVVQQHLLGLLAGLPSPPRAVRVQSGDIVVDISWAQPDAVSSAPPARDAGPAQLVNSPEQQQFVSVSDEPVPDQAAQYLTSPSVGVFYHCSEPGADPFVSVGSVVKPGQQIGIIEAMKLMIPIEAELEGMITDVLKGNGQPVEFAERLFALAVPTTES